MTGIEWLSAVLVAAGGAFLLSGTVGLLRFPDTLSRLHALTKADNLGLGLVCLGLAVIDGTISGILTLAFVWLFAMVAATFSAFLIAGWEVETRPGEDHTA